MLLRNALEMINRFPTPVCSDDCGDNLPAVAFDDCNPEINDAEIEEIFFTNKDQPLVDWTSAAEWDGRIDNTAPNPDSILRLCVVGDKPEPTRTEREISKGRKISGKKDHVVNFEIDETNETNHEFLRQLECGAQLKMWYKTSSGLLFGGNEGIDASVFLDMSIPRSRNEIITYIGKADWKAKFTEERIDSPI